MSYAPAFAADPGEREVGRHEQSPIDDRPATSRVQSGAASTATGAAGNAGPGTRSTAAARDPQPRPASKAATASHHWPWAATEAATGGYRAPRFPAEAETARHRRPGRAGEEPRRSSIWPRTCSGVPEEARWSHLQANAKLIDGRDRGGESPGCSKEVPLCLTGTVSKIC
jgi:hypothetical protein